MQAKYEYQPHIDIIILGRSWLILTVHLGGVKSLVWSIRTFILCCTCPCTGWQKSVLDPHFFDKTKTQRKPKVRSLRDFNFVPNKVKKMLKLSSAEGIMKKVYHIYFRKSQCVQFLHPVIIHYSPHGVPCPCNNWGQLEYTIYTISQLGRVGRNRYWTLILTLS